MVILDTNIIIDHIRIPKKSDSHFIKIAHLKPKETFALSVISIQELYAGKSSKEIEKEKDMLAIIIVLQVLPYTYNVAQLAGEIIRDSKNPISFADAAIASTAILNNGDLATLNKKHYQNIKGLQFVDTAKSSAS